MENKKKNRNLSSLIKKYQDEDIIDSFAKPKGEDLTLNLPLNKIQFPYICKDHFFNDQDYKDLKKSIKDNGILNPILVRKHENEYEVVSGFKRYYFAKKMGFETIPCFVKDVDDDLLIYLILNRSASKLHDNILTKTSTFNILTKEFHVLRKDIALISKISISQVNNIIRLDKLPIEVKQAIKKEKITYGQARALVGLSDEDANKYLQEIIENNLSAREIERLITSYKHPSPYQEKMDRLASANNAKFEVSRNKLTIRFKSKKDLNKFIKEKLQED